jgi:L-lactate dehydrogenase complex protein LldG
MPVANVLTLFTATVRDYRAEVSVVRGEDVPEALSSILASNQASNVVVPEGLPARWLTRLDRVRVTTDGVGGLLLGARELDAVDAVITGAAVGIATTGTIVLDHGPDQGRRALSLIPDFHLCVIRADQLVGDVPECVARLSLAASSTRTLTWISGPSATSDIELERVEGVHGPRTLHVVVIV